MKLMIIIIRDVDVDNVVQELIEKDFRTTRVSSTGGFLRHGNVTLMIGVEQEKVEDVIDILRNACCPPEDSQHRATIFVLDMPYYTQI